MFRHVSRRAAAKQREVGLREGASGSTPAYDITLLRTKRYDITNPKPVETRNYTPAPRAPARTHNGRAGTAGSSTPGPFSLQSSALNCCVDSPFDDDLSLGLSHTHVTSPMIPVCVLPLALWLHYLGRPNLPVLLHGELELSPKVNIIRPF